MTERRQQILHYGRTVAYLRTDIPETHDAGMITSTIASMTAQHVSWLQRDFDELQTRHNQLQQEHRQLQQSYQALAEKVNLMWHCLEMPGAIEASENFCSSAMKNDI